MGDYVTGTLPSWWESAVEQGLTSLHLPAEHGGAGASFVELAVVLEETAFGLLPGPLLPAVLTSALLTRFADEELRTRVLGRLATGERAATVLTANGLTAVPSGTGYIVSGTSVPVLGAPGAQLLLLGAQADDHEVWFVVDVGNGAASDVEIVAGAPVDQSRAVGKVTLDGLPIDADQLVGVQSGQVRALAAALFAAEAVGLSRRCLAIGLDYVKVREQFGRPVGSYQAIKHKCARMFIRTEVMTAAAWDAARAVDEDDEQAALAAAEGVIVCLPAATETGLDTITLLGGIGYTWEHDTHLYWRRAMTLENLLGPVSDWERRLGELYGTTTRDFAVGLSEENAEYRSWVASILEEVALLPTGEARQRRLAGEGLVLPHYPRPYGVAANPTEQILIQQEYLRAGVAQPQTIVGEWALPTILAHGTEEQKEFFVPPTLAGDIVWCQLFSEPGAGSDLASLATRAERVDGGWKLNGQKVWTTDAHEAHHGICLARTDPSAPKHHGISYFLVDMHAPGVEVRPLREASGEYRFNEVFLDDVVVPDSRLVGEVNEGWKIARTTLSNERVSISGQLGIRLDLAGLAGSNLLEAADADVRRDIGAVVAQAYALAAMGMRSSIRQLSGFQPGPEASAAKAAAGINATEIYSRAVRWFGAMAASADGSAAEVLAGLLGSPAVLLAGGTIEIQLNVIAERILGLPRG
jgi:alkylation response protein AidB-like acyl-CoA dehydrogenase